MGVRIVQVDLAQPLPIIRTGKRRAALWILVKLGLQPLGWAKCRANQFGREISPAQLTQLIADQLPLQIFDAARRHSLDSAHAQPLPSVSIVIPTRNNAAILQRTLASLTWLNHPRFEVIVVDNAPANDETRDVCTPFDFVHHVREPRPGIGYARNTGYQVARNEIVVYLDDSTLVDANYLAALTQNFADPRVACVSGLTLPSALDNAAARNFDRLNDSKETFKRRLFAPGAWNSSIWLDLARLGSATNFAIRRSAITQISGFDPALDRGGILDLFTRVLRDGHHLVHDPRALVFTQRAQTLATLSQSAIDFGFSLAICCSKFFHDTELANSSAITLKRWIREQGIHRFGENLKAALCLRPHTPLHLIALELAGAALATNAYRRSIRHVKNDTLRFRQKGIVRRAA